MVKIIDFKQLSEMNISEIEKIKWVNEALCVKKTSILPAKLSLKPEKEIFYNVMPTIIPSLNVAGVKIVNRYPKRFPTLDSQIMLYDLDTGNLKAILDGNFITTARTGAVAAHSVNLFAKKNFKSIGFVGLGNQGRSALKAILSQFFNKKCVLTW